MTSPSSFQRPLGLRITAAVLGAIGAIWAVTVRVYTVTGQHIDKTSVDIFVDDYTGFNLLEKLSGEAPRGMSFTPQLVVLGLAAAALAFAFWPETPTTSA